MTIEEILSKSGDMINDEIKKSFREQGHHLTGAWENSIFSKMDGQELQGYADSYGAIVDYGVNANKIPFGGSTGTGGVSKYIQGLFGYFKQRGLSDKGALRAAFATAHRQKEEGMSTLASRRFSATGDRQHFIQKAFTPQVDDFIFSGMTDIINESTYEEKEIIY